MKTLMRIIITSRERPREFCLCFSLPTSHLPLTTALKRPSSFRGSKTRWNCPSARDSLLFTDRCSLPLPVLAPPKGKPQTLWRSKVCAFLPLAPAHSSPLSLSLVTDAGPCAWPAPLSRRRRPRPAPPGNQRGVAQKMTGRRPPLRSPLVTTEPASSRSRTIRRETPSQRGGKAAPFLCAGLSVVAER